MTLTSFISTIGCISHGHWTLNMTNLLKQKLTWSFPTESGTFYSPKLSSGERDMEDMRADLASKIRQRRVWVLHSFPWPSSLGHLLHSVAGSHFPFSLFLLWCTLLLPFLSTARFISSWTLTSLMPFLKSQAILLYSLLETCFFFHFLYFYFLHFISIRSSLFSWFSVLLLLSHWLIM